MDQNIEQRKNITFQAFLDLGMFSSKLLVYNTITSEVFYITPSGVGNQFSSLLVFKNKPGERLISPDNITYNADEVDTNCQIFDGIVDAYEQEENTEELGQALLAFYQYVGRLLVDFLNEHNALP